MELAKYRPFHVSNEASEYALNLPSYVGSTPVPGKHILHHILNLKYYL